MFEEATRLKLRFETSQGLLGVEDIWDLPLTTAKTTAATSLDSLAQSLNKQLKDTEDGSFVLKSTEPNVARQRLQLRFDVVKHIIDVKLAENEARAKAKERAEQKQKLLGVLAKKEDAEVEGKSREEIKAMIAAL